MKYIGRTSSGYHLIVEMTDREFDNLSSDTDIENIGDTMKSHRIKSGKTQGEMAESIGCSRTYYSMIERGEAENYSWRIRLAIVSELRK